MESFLKRVALLAVLAIMACALCSPAVAQSHRQKTKNQWRNLAIGSGALGLLGLVKGDSTLTFLGGAGAAYSAYRYEQDRKSQSRHRRARAELFRRGAFDRGGHHYVKRTRYRHGRKYYYFVRVS